MKECKPSPECFSLLLRECLQGGEPVQIDDLGIFMPGPNSNDFVFIPNQMQRVFIAYVEEDLELAKRLHRDLTHRGFSAWLDKKRLLPGQNWTRAIESAIENSDFFIACFSKNSVTKRGIFHSELRYALECASRLPLEDIFLIPIRLDKCAVPRLLENRIQYVDLFPDWDAGVEMVTAAMQRQMSTPESNHR
jgi:hypothetical protein